MALTLGKVALFITGDDKHLKSTLKGAGDETRSWASSVGGTLKTAIGTGLGFIGAQVVGAGLGFVKDQIGSFIEAAQDAQRVEAQLDAVLASTGGVAGVTKEQITGLANELSKVTPIEDDTIVGAQSMLLTFTNIGKDVFPATTEAVLDMATAMNRGAIPTAEQLQSQAVLVGKALNDPVKGLSALTRVGVTFTQQQKDQIAAMVAAGDTAGAQKVILAELAKEFGGSAKAAGQTFAGQMAIVNNQIGNVKESIGMALLPILSRLATAVAPLVIDFLEKFAAQIPALMAYVNNLATYVINLVNGFVALFNQSGASETFSAGLGTIVTVAQQVVAWVVANWPQIQATIVDTFNQVVAFLSPWVESVRSIITSVFANISQFLQAHGGEIQAFIQAAWQQIGVIVGLALEIIQATIIPAFQAIAGFIAAHGAEIQGYMTGVWTIIQGIIQLALNLVQGILQAGLALIRGDWDGAWAAITTMFELVWGNIQTIFSGALTQITAILTAFNLIEIGRNLIDGLWAGIAGAWAGMLAKFGELVALLPEAVKKILGIASPSQVFADLGTSMAAGLGVGFERGLARVAADMQAGAGGLAGVLGGAGLAGAGAGGHQINIYQTFAPGTPAETRRAARQGGEEGLAAAMRRQGMGALAG